MSDAQDPSRLEEGAALHSLGLLDQAGRDALLAAARRDPEAGRLVAEFEETAALLAHAAPGIQPPPALRLKILRALPAREATSKIIPFAAWIPYAIAACLMILGVAEARRIADLKTQVRSEHTQLVAKSEEAARLNQRNALIGLRLATLEAKDATYAASKIMVAWDPGRHQGVVAMENLPNPPDGRVYQLWVLDPGAAAPVSAGLISGSRTFAVTPVTTSSPGFAISLEPAGGRPEPTGPILFAVAPGS